MVDFSKISYGGIGCMTQFLKNPIFALILLNHRQLISPYVSLIILFVLNIHNYTRKFSK